MDKWNWSLAVVVAAIVVFWTMITLSIVWVWG